MIRMCNECLRVISSSNGHHPNCPEAEHAPEQTFTMWAMRGHMTDVGRAIEEKIVREKPMRAAAKAWGFNADTVIEDGEAYITNEHGIIVGGCYVNESEVWDCE